MGNKRESTEIENTNDYKGTRSVRYWTDIVRGEGASKSG